MGSNPSDGRLWKWCSPKVTKAIFWGHMFFQKRSFCSSRIRTDFPLHLNMPETKKCTPRWGHEGLGFILYVFLFSLCLSSSCVSPAPHRVCMCVFTHVPTHLRHFPFLVFVCLSESISVSLSLFGYSAVGSWLSYMIYLRLHRPQERPWLLLPATSLPELAGNSHSNPWHKSEGATDDSTWPFSHPRVTKWIRDPPSLQ